MTLLLHETTNEDQVLLAAPAGQAAIRAGVKQLPLRAAQYAALFVVTVVVSRALGPAGRAQYALPLALSSVIALVFGFSLEDVGGRVLAKRVATPGELLRAFAAALPALSIAGALLAGILGTALRRRYLAGADAETVWLSALTVLLSIPANACGGILIRIGALVWYFRALAVGAATQLAVVVACDWFGVLSPRVAMLAYALSLVATVTIVCGALVTQLGSRAFLPRLPPTLLRTVAQGAFSVHGATVSNYLNLRVDVLLLGALASSRQVGLYSIAASLAALVFAAFETVSQGLAHPVTELGHDDGISHSTGFVQQAWPILGALVALTAVGAYPLVRLVYGPAWTGSVAPLVILAAAAGGLAIAGSFHLALLRYGRLGALTAVSVFASAVNVVANVVLIPMAGINGAAAASFLSYWLLAVVLARMFARSTGTPVSALVRRSRPC